MIIARKTVFFPRIFWNPKKAHHYAITLKIEMPTFKRKCNTCRTLMVIANENANDPTACHRLPSKVEVIFFIPKMVNLEPYPGFVDELYFAPTS